ncbi:MAG: hypothetical protein MRJ67_16725 [Nitrospirales bacterium]|nr:hypothetical protein [Nitrospirales bacterium]
MSLFLSPVKTEEFLWGPGPVLHSPTGTDEVLSPRKWGAGPSGLGFYPHGLWVMGLLTSNIWSYAGNNNRNDMSQFLAQYLSRFMTS